MAVPAPPLAEFHDFFAASVGAAAALVGLLFVAISLAPERTFGANADSLRRANAERAFTALGNVFFVSLAALLPRSSIGAIAVIALLAIVQRAQVAVSGWRKRSGSYNWREAGLISLGIYGFELVLAIRILIGGDVHDGIVWVMFGLYAYALGASWGLMGANDAGEKR
jgi:hypothetical protein